MTGAAAPTAARDRALARPSVRLVAAFAVATVALLVGGCLFYRSQERIERAEARDALTAVSVLKVDQISAGGRVGSLTRPCGVRIPTWPSL
jgi:hypothetical protein